MPTQPSQMLQEVLQIPEAVERLLANGASDIQQAAAAIRDLDPAFGVTVARGSSDHVCTYLKYAAELLLGVPFASLGPSIVSIYDAPLKLAGAVSLSVSQSGKSPDIVKATRAAARSGALTVSITNHADSPLAEASTHRLNMWAGPELSVAATKTLVTSAVAGLMLLAEWREDADLRKAIQSLPRQLEAAARLTWPEVRDALLDAQSVFTLGRGPTWAISNEAALKFKETCQIHAESYSSAEVMHGPVSVVGSGFPVLCFAANDAAQPALVDVADQIAQLGARAFVTGEGAAHAQRIDHVRTDHPLTDPISLIVSFYAMVESVAVSRGLDPDKPQHLRKVTETV